MEMKHCKRCGRDLLLSEFHKDRKRKDGLAFYCKECSAEYGRKYRHSPRGIFASLKSGDRYYTGVPIDFTKKEFVRWYNAQPKKCAYCGVPSEKLELIGSYYYDKCDRLTIDRKDNNQGYTLNNITLACYRCNFIKADIFSYIEMCEIGEKYLKPKWEKEESQ